MNCTRRDFIRQTALLSAGTLLPLRFLRAQLGNRALVGIQLYSVRADMKADPAGTLKKLAGMGYRYVEHANYVNRKFYGYTPVDFKKLLQDLGLEMRSGHTVMGKEHWDSVKKDFTDSWKYTVEDAALVGQEYVISPWLDNSMRKTADDLKRYMDVFNACGRLCQKWNMKFGYHNHDFEFTEKMGNGTLYEAILENTDPELVIQQLDTGNMHGTGTEAFAVIKKYPGRFQSLHIKDEIAAAGKGEMGHAFESTLLGKGVVPVKDILAFCTANGTRHIIIEQESYQQIQPLETCRLNLQTLQEWGY
ncbi:MAG: sugar phosphate isomerase/epimerase family protein [Sediminibacterium sp.]